MYLISLKNAVLSILAINVVFTSSLTTATLINFPQAALAEDSCPLIDNRPNPPIQSALLYIAETKNYKLLICSDYSGNPAFYIGNAKNGSGSITLPLQSYRNNQFVAVNGNTPYTLSQNLLLVTRGRKTITRERIIRWQRVQEDA